MFPIKVLCVVDVENIDKNEKSILNCAVCEECYPSTDGINGIKHICVK